MHELAVCQSLLREVERVASAHGNLDVTAIVVAVGPLSGVEAPLLTRAFSVARAGTIAEHAVLEIETMPVTVWCKDCGVQTEVRPNALLCGNCDAWQVELRSGDELLLRRVELVSADTAAAAS
jgi:hydrogenase nickel incorporation protein HypA/HybF